MAVLGLRLVYANGYQSSKLEGFQAEHGVGLYNASAAPTTWPVHTCTYTYAYTYHYMQFPSSPLTV